jgi:hypothetical protein
MAALVIESPLSERIRAIAEHERRPIEAVLEAMIEKYTSSLTDREINARLRAVGGFILPADEPAEPPISEEELDKIARRVGAAGPLSTLIIEERKQGW